MKRLMPSLTEELAHHEGHEEHEGYGLCDREAENLCSVRPSLPVSVRMQIGTPRLVTVTNTVDEP